MEAEFEARPSRVRSSHKLASCRGRQYSWTVPIWILEAWTRANLAQPDGKCRERAAAPIPLPGVEACGPVLSFRVVWHSVVCSLTCSHVLSHHKIKESIMWIRTCTHRASCLIMSLTTYVTSVNIWLWTQLWYFETHKIDLRLKRVIIMIHFSITTSWILRQIPRDSFIFTVQLAKWFIHVFPKTLNNKIKIMFYESVKHTYNIYKYKWIVNRIFVFKIISLI